MAGNRGVAVLIVVLMIALGADALLLCPVCGMAGLHEHAVSFEHGQDVLACSGEHRWMVESAPENYTSGTSLASDVTCAAFDQQSVCPVCGMVADQHFFVGFKHGQCVFTCNQEHARVVDDHPNSFLQSKNNMTEPFCVGGSVMLSGFQFAGQSEVCLQLWFPSWTLNTHVKYACGLIGLVAMGVAHELLTYARKLMEIKSLKRHTEHPARTAVSCVLYCCSLALGYFLMLATMTYEVGCLLSVIAGLGLGRFWTSRLYIANLNLAAFSTYGINGDTLGESLRLVNEDPCCQT